MKPDPHTATPDPMAHRLKAQAQKVKQMGINMLFAAGAVIALFLFMFLGWPEIEGWSEVSGPVVARNGWGIGTENKPNGVHNLLEMNIDYLASFPKTSPEAETLNEMGNGEIKNGLAQSRINLDNIGEEPGPTGELSIPLGKQKMTKVELNEETEEWLSWESVCMGYPGCPAFPFPISPPEEEDHVTPDPEVMYDWVEKSPKAININEIKQAIEYPVALQSAGIEGRVIFRVLVDNKGRYVKHKVIKSAHPQLTELALSGLKKLTFEPAVKNGERVKAYVTIPFLFQPQT